MPKISIPIDYGATSSSSKGKGKGTTDTTEFLPDSFILGNKVMHSVGKELAGEWYDLFLLRLHQSKDRKHQLYRAIADRTNSNHTSSNNSNNTKKRKASDDELLDEATMMKCRFVSALNDFERSGIIKCSFSSDSSGSGSGGTQKAMAIARHVYTWL